MEIPNLFAAARAQSVDWIPSIATYFHSTCIFIIVRVQAEANNNENTILYTLVACVCIQ